MRKKENRLEKIALKLGVSLSTVSRALNGTGRISEARRAEIVRIASEVGYLPLRNRKTVAVILPQSQSELQWYSIQLLNQLRIEGTRHGFLLEFISSDQLELLDSTVLCGIISFDYSEELAARVARCSSMPLVCINSYSRHIDQIYSVYSDDAHIIRTAVERLASAGHHKIALTLTDDSVITRVRRRSFADVVREFGLYQGNDAVFPSSYRPETIVSRILQKNFTAVIAAGEGSAPRLLAALRQAGKRVPDDVSVIGWEMPAVSEFLQPPLTTVGQDFRALSCRSFEVLEKHLRKEVVNTDIFVPCILNERASVSAP